MRQRLPDTSLEQRLREIVATIPLPAQSGIILTIRDDAERRGRSGLSKGSGILPTIAELLIDAEEDPALRAVLVGLLRESERP